MLHLANLFRILSLFLSCLCFIGQWYRVLPFRWCKAVKYTYVTYIVWTPETICSYVNSCIVFFICGATRLSLSGRFLRISSTATLEHTSVEGEAVMFLISLCRKFGEPSLLQERACSKRKGLPHMHSTRGVFRHPALLKGQGIMKGSLVQDETMLSYWERT